MKNLSRILASISLLLFLSIVSLHAQSENRETRSRLKDALNPKWTVIIDYVDTFTGHKPKHQPPTESPPPEEECPDGDPHCPNKHFEVIGGVWSDLLPEGVVDPYLIFSVDLRLFPEGSGPAIQAAFNAWQMETAGLLVQDLIFEDVMLGFADGFSTYTMRNLGGGGVLAATFITWDDWNENDVIDNREPFLEMDVIHNSTVKWGIAGSNPKGRWWDVQNVATHELGHVFGLAHPSGHEADKVQTMFASAPPKETSKQTLEADGDIPGIQSDFLGYQ